MGEGGERLGAGFWVLDRQPNKQPSGWGVHGFLMLFVTSYKLVTVRENKKIININVSIKL